MPINYNPDELVALNARQVTLRTALKESPDQIGATAALWRERGLEPTFYDADQIIQLRNTMAFLEYAMALQAFAFAGTHATVLHRGALSDADIQLERFGLRNTPKRIAIMEAIWFRSRTSVGSDVGNDTEVFYPSNGGIWKGTRRAIHAKGLNIVPDSQDFVPYQWLNEEGFVDPELAREYPYPHRAA